MTFNAMTEHYEEITVCGKPALFHQHPHQERYHSGWSVRLRCFGMMTSAGASLCEIAPFVIGQPLGHHHPCGTAGTAG